MCTEYDKIKKRGHRAYSTKTRIETLCVRNMAKLKKGVTEHIPLKQGLRLPLVRAYPRFVTCHRAYSTKISID